MEQQERESLLYSKRQGFLSVNHQDDGEDDEESLLGTVLPASMTSSSSSSPFPSGGGNGGRFRASSRSSGPLSFLCYGAASANNNSGEKRWQRWAFFLAGFIFFVAFFSLLLLLFFDVIHVANDDLQPSGPSSPRGRFFQLSDVHMDVLYNAAMNRSTLCRQSIPTEAEADFVSPVRGDRVGKSFPYGQYGCDSPVELVRSALDAMYGVDSKPDFILVTGDIPAHALPTRAVHNETIALFTSMVRQVFPSTLVLPLLGNNDVFPDYHLPYGPNTWLSYLADLWSPWLGEEQRGTFIRGGYYSMKIPAATNLRVIALNTVLYSVEFVPTSSGDGPYSSCASNPPADPNGQFMWLKNELAQAKVKNEKVIITGHIPYGVNEYDGSINWCPSYVDTYLNIIYPFAEDVIINQIFAHYHLDEFRVLLSPRNPQQAASDDAGSATREQTDDAKQVAVSNIMIHPSISPQHDNNPSFRYYHYYRETGTISDYDHFYLDLALVNLLPAPRWILEYTFRGAYAATGVDTTSFAGVWETITSGSSLHFARYLSYKTSLYIANALPNLCAISSTGPEDYQRCLLSHSDVDAAPAHRQDL